MVPADIDFELTKPVPVAHESKDNAAAEVRDLKKILAAESSAVETYKQLLKKFQDFKGFNDLKDILQDHKKAVEFWKTQLRSKDIQVKDMASPWSHAASALALQELKLGEAHGLSLYEELIHNNKVNFQSLSFIRNIGLDQQRKHLAILDGLLELV